VLLGRAAGLTDEQLAHLADEDRPDGIYDDSEWAIVKYAQVSTRNEPITNSLYAEMRTHFSEQQIIETCFTIGLSNTINRFHATFLTDVDDSTQTALAPSCPLQYPRISEESSYDLS
jgi:alkylhydroperoxidase family enzyme